MLYKDYWCWKIPQHVKPISLNHLSQLITIFKTCLIIVFLLYIIALATPRSWVLMAREHTFQQHGTLDENVFQMQCNPNAQEIWTRHLAYVCIMGMKMVSKEAKATTFMCQEALKDNAGLKQHNGEFE